MGEDRKPHTTAVCPEPDHNAKKRKGTKWCAYCCNWQKFAGKQMNGYVSNPKCEGCGISTEDFWYKMANKEWGIEKGTIKPRGR